MRVIVVFISILLLGNYCYGDGNIAEISQSGGGENIAMIEQTGHNNIAVVEQGIFVGFFRDFSSKDFVACPFPYYLGRESQTRLYVRGNNNFVFQHQWGEKNFAGLFIRGNGNMAMQAQIGNGNQSIAGIFGKFNSFFHLQYGNGLILPTISVMGNGKEFHMIQKGDKEK